MKLRRGWLKHASTVIRWTRIIGYLAFAVSGAVSLVHPPASIQASTGWAVTLYGWAALLAISSIICMVGAIGDRWVGEYVGLIPLGASAFVFALAAMSRGLSGVAGGAFLFGFFWLLASRWQEVALLRIESTRRAQEHREDPQ